MGPWVSEGEDESLAHREVAWKDANPQGSKNSIRLVAAMYRRESLALVADSKWEFQMQLLVVGEGVVPGEEDWQEVHDDDAKR